MESIPHMENMLLPIKSVIEIVVAVAVQSAFHLEMHFTTESESDCSLSKQPKKNSSTVIADF